MEVAKLDKYSPVSLFNDKTPPGAAQLLLFVSLATEQGRRQHWQLKEVILLLSNTQDWTCSSNQPLHCEIHRFLKSLH